MNRNTKQIVTAGLAAVVLVCAAGSVSAASVFKVDEGDWAVNTNWTGDAVPGAADSAYVRGDRIVNVTSDVGTITKLYVGDIATWGVNGTVNISGGKLTTSTASEIGRRVDGANGVLSISGGTFESGDSSGSQAILVGVDTSTAHTTGLLEVSGTGSFFGRAVIGSDEVGDSGDVFRIIGSDVTVGNTSTLGTTSVEVRNSGSVEFIFDAAGIATASFQEIFTFSAGSDGIIVDGSAYAGGADTFTLLEAGVISSTAPNIELVGFAEGTTYDWNSTTDTFSITTVPEPATIGMLGIGALIMMVIRRWTR